MKISSIKNIEEEICIAKIVILIQAEKLISFLNLLGLTKSYRKVF